MYLREQVDSSRSAAETGGLVEVRAVPAAAVAARAAVPQEGGGEDPVPGGRVGGAVLAGAQGAGVGGQDGPVVGPRRVEAGRVGHDQGGREAAVGDAHRPSLAAGPAGSRLLRSRPPPPRPEELPWASPAPPTRSPCGSTSVPTRWASAASPPRSASRRARWWRSTSLSPTPICWSSTSPATPS